MRREGAAHADRGLAITRKRWRRRTATVLARRRKAIEAIRQRGLSRRQTATTNVQEAHHADIGLDKATSLARSQDAAAVNTEG